MATEPALAPLPMMSCRVDSVTCWLSLSVSPVYRLYSVGTRGDVRSKNQIRRISLPLAPPVVGSALCLIRWLSATVNHSQVHHNHFYRAASPLSRSRRRTQCRLRRESYKPSRVGFPLEVPQQSYKYSVWLAA